MKPVACTVLTLTAFGVGIAVGLGLPRQAPRSDPAAETVRPTNVNVKTASAATSETSPLRHSVPDAPVAEAKTRAPAAPPSWKVLSDLIGQKVIPATSLRVLGPNGKLTPQIIRLFDLGPDDVQAVQRCFDDVSERLNALEKSNTTVAPGPGGTIAINVQPFAQAGTAVYDEMTSRLEAALGRERSAGFVGIAGEEIERNFNRFGAQEGATVISYTPNSPDGAYTVTERHMSAPGQYSESRSSYAKPDDLLTRVGANADAVRALLPQLAASTNTGAH